MQTNEVKLIRKSEQITSAWSGGTTTQLFIYPENASYQERNFLFRISTAKVDVEESVFTKLPGISRQIMILDGILKLEHTGRYTKILHKFETDYFDGNWETKGYGKVTDFNLMTNGKVQGSLIGKSLKKNESIQFQTINSGNLLGFYVVKGILEIKTDLETLNLNDNDFLFLDLIRNSNKVELKANEVSEIVVTEIYLTMNFLE